MKQKRQNGSAEMRVYELLGIRFFRKFVLFIERIRHHRDGGRNKNYHPDDLSAGTLRQFSGYLWYNALLHIISLIFAGAYVLLACLFRLNNVFIGVVVTLVYVLNVYCLFLQRYIYLKLWQSLCRKQQTADRKRAVRYEHICAQLTGAENTDEAVAFLRALRHRVEAGTDVMLTADDEAILSEIAALCPETHKPEVPSVAMTMAELMAALPRDPQIVGKTARRAARIQRVRRAEEKHGFVVTGTPTAERAYARIFTESSADAVLETIDVLLSAYGTHRNEVTAQ